VNGCKDSQLITPTLRRRPLQPQRRSQLTCLRARPRRRCIIAPALEFWSWRGAWTAGVGCQHAPRSTQRV